MKFVGLAACAAAVALATGAAASTDPYILTATFQGTVPSGYDYQGYFGAFNASNSGAAYTNLAGASFTAVYTVDLSRPATTWAAPGYISQTYGSTIYGDQSPVVNVAVTINGKTLTINTSDSRAGIYTFGEITQQTLYSGKAGVYYAGDWDNGIENFAIDNQVFSEVNPVVTTYYYNKSLSYTVQPEDSSLGDLTASWDFYTGADSQTIMDIELNATSVNIVAAAIPEPGAWTMLILGMGMIGAVPRRRRERASLIA